MWLYVYFMVDSRIYAPALETVVSFFSPLLYKAQFGLTNLRYNSNEKTIDSTTIIMNINHCLFRLVYYMLVGIFVSPGGIFVSPGQTLFSLALSE